MSLSALALVLLVVAILLCRYAVQDFRDNDHRGAIFALSLVALFVGLICYQYAWLLPVIGKLVIALVLVALMVFGPLAADSRHE